MEESLWGHQAKSSFLLSLLSKAVDTTSAFHATLTERVTNRKEGTACEHVREETPSACGGGSPDEKQCHSNTSEIRSWIGLISSMAEKARREKYGCAADVNSHNEDA